MKKVTAVCLVVLLMSMLFAGNALAFMNYTGSTQFTGSVEGAGAVMLFDADSGTILFQKNIDQKIEPASTTKIMTLVLALENGNMDDIVTVSSKAAGQLGSTLIPKLKNGEEVVFEDLINGMMMASGNDAAMAVAEHLGDTVDGFVTMMNAKASELGMTNTHFVTPHGLHDPDHVTTARDMAMLTQYALHNPQFVKIVNQKSYTMPKTNSNGERVVQNTNKLMQPDEPYYYQYATGVKTGSTKTQYSGDCLVSSASKDGMNLVCLIFKTEEGNPLRWTLSKDLFEWGFTNFKTVDLVTLMEKAEPLQAVVENAAASDSGVLEFNAPEAGTIFVTLNKAVADAILNGTDTIKTEMVFDQNPLHAPITKDDVVGTVVYKSAGTDTTLYSGSLIASRDIPVAGADSNVSGATAVGTQRPMLPEEVTKKSNGSVWWWLLLPGALIALLVVGLLTVNRRRHKRFKHRQPHYKIKR